MKKKAKISCYSEDGAAVYEVNLVDGGRKVDSHYIGYDDLRYGNKKSIDAEYAAWLAELNTKYEIVK